MFRIDGSYLEGGGQILRTSLALSTILNKEIEIFNIRRGRKNPGLAEQHLRVIEAFKHIFGAKAEGDKLSSQQIQFYPSQKVKDTYVKIHPKTSSSIGLILQAVLPALYFLNKRLTLELKGGTVGKWAPPFDFYPYIVFPLLNIKARCEIKRRGYYPKGQGLIIITFEKFLPQGINLIERGRLERIKIMSFAANQLRQRRVAERQAEAVLKILKEELKDEINVDMEKEYFETASIGSEINLCAYFSAGVRLWADGLGERAKTAEEVGRDAAYKLLKELGSDSCCDVHLADNLIPYLAFLGGKIKTSCVSQHTLTNIWVCENFLGKIFEIKDNLIEVIGAN